MPPTLRGAQVAPNRTEADVKALTDAGANLIRYQLTNLGPVNNINSDAGYKFWIDHELNIVEPILKNYKNKANAIIDFHTPPGGFANNRAVLFGQPTFRETLLQTWEITATRYKDKSEVWAYDILNEPAGNNASVKGLMTDAVTRIRKIDKDKRILVSCAYGDAARWESVPFLNDNRVIYQVHFYYPMGITHQGLGSYSPGKVYPTAKTNKDKLIEYLKPVRNWQLKNKTRIYVGEFGICTNASQETRFKWFKDAIEIFETYGWHWSFHAWRESPVWSIEGQTKVFNLFKSYWAKNKGI